MRPLMLLLCAVLACALPARAAAPFQIDGAIGLSSLISLCDGHLSTVADTLEAIAGTPAAQSGDWSALRSAFKTGGIGLPASIFYAGRDGVGHRLNTQGATIPLGDRPYFAKVLKGDVVIGDLIVSRSTGRAATIVAVPVHSARGAIVGVLGASVFLDDLSALLKREMGVSGNVIFWAIDGTGKIAIHSDAANIFVEPAKQSPALAKVRDQMLAADSGTMTYTFNGAERTVIFRKSAITGWRYGFGVVK